MIATVLLHLPGLLVINPARPLLFLPRPCVYAVTVPPVPFGLKCRRTSMTSPFLVEDWMIRGTQSSRVALIRRARFRHRRSARVGTL